jgi:hypothetical protein
MKIIELLLLLACLAPLAARAAEINLATLSCDKYENEILASAADDPKKSVDSINTVMWLFGYSVAKAGEHVMYGDALTSFGFALDVECKNSPSTSLLQAVTSVRPKRDKPMDLSSLICSDFEARHALTAQSDPDSATTIMMWLYGFSVATSGSHMLDLAGVRQFESSLGESCSKHPDESLFDALSSLNRSAAKR